MGSLGLVRTAIVSATYATHGATFLASEVGRRRAISYRRTRAVDSSMATSLLIVEWLRGVPSIMVVFGEVASIARRFARRP